MGDVAMTVPVIYSLATQHKDLNITVLSRKNFEPFFEDMPQNVSFKGVDLKNEYMGLMGLKNLAEELKKENFDAVADFHDVLRTKMLRQYLKVSGIKTAYIKKGRIEKHKATRRFFKKRVQLKSSFERYADVLRKLGFDIKLDFNPLHKKSEEKIKKIGIAPFAKHKAKTYPLNKMESIVDKLTQNEDYQVFLFGGGKKEHDILAQWEKKYPRCISLSGKYELKEELKQISNLDVMLSMDSANMHMASLKGVPVVSVWGGTHSCCGFLGWKQKSDNIIERDLKCRPCSVFGNKKCRFEQYQCLDIEPEVIIERIKNQV